MFSLSMSAIGVSAFYFQSVRYLCIMRVTLAQVQIESKYECILAEVSPEILCVLVAG